MYSEIDRCRICGDTSQLSILSLGEQYLTGVFPAAPDEKITKVP